jgi:hypothetical protein
MPATNSTNTGSVKAFQSTIGPVDRGGSLGRMNVKAIASNPRFKNPRTRVVHAKPILGNSSRTSTGYTMPPVNRQSDLNPNLPRRGYQNKPTEFPVVTTPTASALLPEKYVAINPILGQKKIPPPIPVKTP